MQKLSLSILFSLSTIYSYAQVKQKTNPLNKPLELTMKLGYGITISEYTYVNCPLYELDISAKLNSRISASTNLGFSYGRDIDVDYIYQMHGKLSRQYLQLNLLYSPWRNDHRNDFKIGLGLSIWHTKLEYYEYRKYIGLQFDEQTIGMPIFWDAVGNLIIEDDFRVLSNFTVGLKAIYQVKSKNILV